MNIWTGFRSLRHHDFRWYFLGQLVSLHGTWMQSVAQAWLVYRLTHSSFMLGLVSFAALVPVLLFGLVGGLVADRLPRRRLFMIAQIIALVQALLLGVLTIAGGIAVEHVMVLAFVLGVVQAFEMPARHSMMADLVPREDLPGAIALNASLFNVARFIGPALAGVLVSWIGEGWVFLVNAASFLAMLLALRAMRPAALAAPAAATYTHWADGLRYAWQQPSIRAGLLMLAAVSLTGVPYQVLLPVFAREVFSGGAATLGILLGSAGAGALLAALWLAQRKNAADLSAVIGRNGIVAGVVLILFTLVDHLAIATPLLMLAGFSVTSVVASINTHIQMCVPDALRGRVMALFSVLFIGMAPLGNLLSGSLAYVLGVQITVAGFGVACVLGAIVFLRAGRRADAAGAQ